MWSDASTFLRREPFDSCPMFELTGMWVRAMVNREWMNGESSFSMLKYSFVFQFAIILSSELFSVGSLSYGKILVGSRWYGGWE